MAVIDNPTLEQLHSDGLLLMLQSEQEKHLIRQLKDAVRKYQSEVSEKERQIKDRILENRIRSSISKNEGISIWQVLEFALKTVIARVLFGRSDMKGQYIFHKFNKNELEWNKITSTFVTDVLENRNTSAALNWWNENWTKLEFQLLIDEMAKNR